MLPDVLTVNGAGWFTVAAFVGTIFFLGRLALMFVGGDGGVDADFDTDIHGDPGDAFKVLSIQAVAAFLMGFGWAGLAGLNGFGWTWTNSLLFAIVAGAGMVWLLGLLLKAVHDLQSTGNVRMESAVGTEGQVYANIPESGSGRGQVQIVIDGRQRLYSAISEGEAIPSQTRIRVIRVNEDRTLTVGRV